MGNKLTRFLLPEDLSCKIDSGDPDLLIIHECGENTFPVACHSGSRLRISFMDSPLPASLMDLGFPFESASVAVET